MTLFSGKTYLMSAIATKCREWLGTSCVVVARYLGTTTDTSNIHSLLLHLVMHLCAVYNLEAPNETIQSSPNRIARAFRNTIEQVGIGPISNSCTLLVFLIMTGIQLYKFILKVQLGHFRPCDNISFLPFVMKITCRYLNGMERDDHWYSYWMA